MRTMLHSIGATLIALTLTLTWQAETIGHAFAMTSPSYQLKDSFGSYETGNGGVSTNYTKDQGGVTWYNDSLTSPSYQLSGGDSESASSESGGGTGGSSGETNTQTSGGTSHGGGRGSVTPPASSPGNTETTPASSSSSRSRVQSSAPRSSSSSVSSSAVSSSASSVSSAEQEYPPIEITAPAVTISSDLNGAHPAAGNPGTTSPSDEGIVTHAVRVIASTITSPSVVAVLPWALISTSAGLTVMNASFLMQRNLPLRFKKTLRKKKGKRSAAPKKKKVPGAVRMILLAVLGIATAVLALLLPLNAHAANNTTPLLRTYNGTLLDSSGHAVTSAITIRFSYWKSSDYVSTDTTATGSVNAGAANYVGWQEVQTVTPNSKGSFSLSLGSVTPLVNLQNLPASTLLNLYLQVEVKPSGSSDTSYELLDSDSASDTIDRSRITSVPFARNADLLDQHDTGTGSSDIPVLDFGGHLPLSTMGSGTNLGTFTIDANDTETSEISLEFGTALGKKLTYDITQSLFIFNASVKVEGNLTVTGLINGTDISSLTAVSDALKASSGGGLNLNVHGGSYRLNGTVTNYAGGNRTLAGSTTNYVFFGSGGLTTNLSGFPSDESYIPVAEVTTSAGAILSIDDRRITSADDRERSVTNTFNPNYEKASYQGDGADNVGQLSVSSDNITLNNFYIWTSTKTTMQDYDLLLRVPVSSDFIRWKSDATTNPVSFNYRTTSASSAQNKLDIQIYDTNGTPVTLSGSTSNLANTSWSTAQVEFTGTPTWTAGQDMLIRIKFSAKDDYQVQLGSLKLQHVDLIQE